MDQKVADLINSQINKELYSAYLYLDFANYYAAGLDGFETGTGCRLRRSGTTPCCFISICTTTARR